MKSLSLCIAAVFEAVLDRVPTGVELVFTSDIFITSKSSVLIFFKPSSSVVQLPFFSQQLK